MNSLSSTKRAVGGREAEKEERQRWDNAESKRIMDSVNSNIFIKFKFYNFFY